MTDLRKTQEAWTRFLGHELAGSYLALLSELAEQERRYRLERTRVVVLGDPDRIVGSQGIRLTGVRLGQNTAPDGSLWATLSAQGFLQLAVAPGQQGVVAQSQGGPLKPFQGSGLGGEWDLPPGASAVQDLRLLVVPDWLARVDGVWTGVEPEDREARRLFADLLGAVAERVEEARQLVRDALIDWAQLRGSAFLGQDVSEIAEEAIVRDPSGAVSRQRGGLVAHLGDAMPSDSVAGAQSIAARRVSVTAVTFPSRNRGQGRVRAFTPGEACPAARWVFTCVRGAEQGLGGQEEFRCSARLESGETLDFEGVRIGAPHMGPRGFGPIALERAPSLKGNAQSLGPLARLSVGNASSRNTDGGVLHWRVLKEGTGTFAVEFYMSLALGSGDLVARAEGLAPSASFQASERNVSGLWIVWALGPQPVHGASGTLDLHFFRADETPDGFVIETSVTPSGELQSLLANEVGAALPSSSTPTIPDGFARSGVLSSLLIGGKK